MTQTATVLVDEPAQTASTSRRRRRGGRRRTAHIARWLACAWLGAIVLLALAGDLLPLHDYRVAVPDLASTTPPRFSLVEPLGTDQIGRSELSRLIFGARQSLTVGVAVVVLAMAAGTMIGLIAGFFRGLADRTISVLIDAVVSVPPLVLLIGVATIGKQDLPSIIIGLTIVITPSFARLARATTLAHADREYVLAAQVIGASKVRVLYREILPNTVFPLLSFAFLMLAFVIVAEGSLSFLGLGIPAPAPSWGGMISSGRAYLATDPYLVLLPSACLLLTVVSISIIGDELRRRMDTRASAI